MLFLCEGLYLGRTQKGASFRGSLHQLLCLTMDTLWSLAMVVAETLPLPAAVLPLAQVLSGVNLLAVRGSVVLRSI